MNRFLKASVFPCLCVGVLVWFYWNSIHGSRGRMQIARIESEIVEKRLELEDLKGERESLYSKVVLLRPNALDPDLLGIRARIMLNHSHPDELIVYLPEDGDGS